MGVVQLGAQPASPTFADDIEHPQENNSSAQLSSNGRSDDKIHPPDCGRPVRLPVDTPELQFAPIPLVFDMVPDATTSSSPDWGGPERGNVSLSPKKEAGATFGLATQSLPGSPIIVSATTEVIDMELPYRGSKNIGLKWDIFISRAADLVEQGGAYNIQHVTSPSRFPGRVVVWLPFGA